MTVEDVLNIDAVMPERSNNGAPRFTMAIPAYWPLS
jgi:hypothetical protein